MRVILAAMTGMGNAAVEALHLNGIDVAAVITDPADKPGFPHYQCEALTDLCQRRRIPVWSRMRLCDPDSVRRIAQAAPNVFVIATSHKIVPVDLVDRLEGRVINCHPSLLPRHRGPTPIPWTIEHGDRETGLTFIRPAPELDAGPVWYTCRTKIDDNETAGELRYRLDTMLLPESLPWVVEGVARGSLEAVPQGQGGTSERRFAQCCRDVNWMTDEAEVCLRRFRARTPHPGSFVEECGRRYSITRLTPAPGGEVRAPGTVEVLDNGEFVIHVVDGRLAAEVSVLPAEAVPVIASGAR